MRASWSLGGFVAVVLLACAGEEGGDPGTAPTDAIGGDATADAVTQDAPSKPEVAIVDAMSDTSSNTTDAGSDVPLLLDAGCDGCDAACVPSCSGKVCGDDGCGGTCGPGCGPDQACQQGQCACTPNCTGKGCGDDGCGGTCAPGCSATQLCDAGVCVHIKPCSAVIACAEFCTTWPCVQDCAVGLDPTGQATWNALATCITETCGGAPSEACDEALAANCAGLLAACQSGTCTSTCKGPEGVAKTCGDDGCGGTCGPACPSGQYCVAGQCTADCADTDGDGTSDCVETDDDGDGAVDEEDNCPLVKNASQGNLDGDGLGDACDPDDDGDALGDGSDNCPNVANKSQANLDGDSQGDACDVDLDGDGVPNVEDACPSDAKNACLTATCSKSCDDGDPCTQDGCVKGACVHAPPEAPVVTWGSTAGTLLVAPTGQTFVSIAARGDHAIGLRADGTVAEWGATSGALPAIAQATAIAAGNLHGLALLESGVVVGWGDDTFGQASVPSLGKVIAIAAGGYHSVALESDGTVVAWGSNLYGQTAFSKAMGPAKAIAAGGVHSVALLHDGSLVVVGFKAWGLLKPPSLSNVTALAAGGEHVLALLADGSIAAWGHNDAGQATVPASLGNVKAIAAGERHSLALLSDGTVVGFGDDTSAQLGAPSAHFYAIAAGSQHSVGLATVDTDEDGIVDCADPCPLLIGTGCVTCDPACNGCLGPTAAECVSCASGFARVDGTCTACVACGADDYEAVACTELTLQQCQPCASACQGCSGATDQDCKACAPGFISVEGACIAPDGDSDGVPDIDDNCVSVANPDQQSHDSDAAGDACDDDDDNDGISDIDDNCPIVATEVPAFDTDGDGAGDACDGDLDGDGAPNANDNCPNVLNGGQHDLDGDLVGDACDPDVDGDGAPNANDNCPDVSNAAQLDTDQDSLGNSCDSDADNDGIANDVDPEPTDGKACGDVDKDLCDDCHLGDFDPMMDGFDADYDGICNDTDPDYLPDVNCDGIPDAIHRCGGASRCIVLGVVLSEPYPGAAGALQGALGVPIYVAIGYESATVTKQGAETTLVDFKVTTASVTDDPTGLFATELTPALVGKTAEVALTATPGEAGVTTLFSLVLNGAPANGVLAMQFLGEVAWHPSIGGFPLPVSFGANTQLTLVRTQDGETTDNLVAAGQTRANLLGSDCARATPFPEGPIDLTSYESTPAVRASFPAVFAGMDPAEPPDRFEVYAEQISEFLATAPGVPPEDLVAIRGYTSGICAGGVPSDADNGCPLTAKKQTPDYAVLNSALRAQAIPALGQYEPYLQCIAAGLSDLTYYVGTVIRNTNVPANVLATYTVGAIVIDHTFMSTSTVDLPEYQGNIKFIIESITGRNVQPLSVFPSEQEILFAPGSRFRVDQVEHVGAQTLVTMSQVL